MRRLASFLFLCGCVSDPVATTDAGVDGQTPSDSAVPMTDVNGTVVDEYGNPTPNAAVRIGVLTATTDMMGKFTLKAEPTYRIDIVHDTTSSSTGKRVLGVVGLTTRTPVIQTLASAARSATINLTFSGVPATLPTNTRIYYWIVPASNTSDSSRTTAPIIDGGSTVLSYMAKWKGADTISGVLTALYVAMTGTDAYPTAFMAMGTAPVTIPAGSMQTVNVAMAATNNSHVPGDVVLNGHTGALAQILYRPEGIRGESFVGPNTTTMFDIPAPKINSWRFLVHSIATTSSKGESHVWKTAIQSGSPNVMLTHRPDFTASAPNDMAAMVDGSTMFSWASQPGAAYALHAECGGSSNPSYVVDVLTTSTSGNLADTSPLGAAPGGSCAWYVQSFVAPSTDALAGPGGWQRLVDPLFADADGAYVQTALRAFAAK